MTTPKEIRRPREGMSTLSAQFSRRMIDKVVAAIQDLRLKGKTEHEILQKMRTELRHVDEHTLQKLHAKSLGLKIADDFTAGQIAGRREIKSGTLAVKLKKEPEWLTVGSIVHLDEEEWVVTARGAVELTLKRLR